MVPISGHSPVNWTPHTQFSLFTSLSNEDLVAIVFVDLEVGKY